MAAGCYDFLSAYFMIAIRLIIAELRRKDIMENETVVNLESENHTESVKKEEK